MPHPHFTRCALSVMILVGGGYTALAARDGRTIAKPLSAPEIAPPAEARTGDDARPVADGVTLNDVVRSSAPQNAWVYFHLYVPPQTASLDVDLFNLSGDADLYLRSVGRPDLESYTCRSAAAGSAAESCRVTQPSPGLWWIGVNGYDTGSIGFSLRADWSCSTASCDSANLTNGSAVSDSINGSSQQSAWNDYYLALPEGASNLIVDLYGLSGDVDLYLHRLELPDLGSFVCRSWNSGTSAEQCEIPLPASGLWWVSVNNYDVGPIGYTLRATWEVRRPSGLSFHDSLNAATSQSGWNDYYVDVPTGATNFTAELFNLTGDLDLYVRAGDKPTTSAYDCASAQPGLTTEGCTNPSPPSGRLWISVNNWDPGRSNYSLRVQWTCGGSCTPREGILLGLGPGPSSPPRSAFVHWDTVGSRYASGVNPYHHYNTLQAGVNVGGAELDGKGFGEYLTGPGNVAVFGPHVRGWELLGPGLARVNYFAYGTLKYGVKVRGIQADTDLFHEILTGAGQGAVFGPHVRGWNYDGGNIQSSPLNFFAYAGLRYGVNIEAVDLEGGGIDEALTAPVFGAGYPTRIRGWDVDISSQVAAIPGIDFYAFNNPNDHGATVAGGDVDGDGYAEILGGRGPAAALNADLRGFSYDGNTVLAFPALDATPFATGYGVNTVLPDVDGSGTAELVAAPGPDPTAAPTLWARRYAGGGLTSIAGLDGMQPFTAEEPGAAEGATLGIGAR